MSDTATGTDNLSYEIAKFSDSLPYCLKYLSSILLAGETIGAKEIDASYHYFLQEAELEEKTDKPIITINLADTSNDNYKQDLFLSTLNNVQGVNALVENQLIEFHPKLTILYGVNGSGKSGYIRLLKKVLHSRNPEEILRNVFLNSGHKEVSAEIGFTSEGKFYSVTYPETPDIPEFRQFSIFDNKSVPIHLDAKNKFEFRPTGLSFFANLNGAVRQLEERIVLAITAYREPKDYSSVFEGESPIKMLIKELSGSTNLEELKKHIPISEEEKKKRVELEEKKAQLMTQKKDKDIAELNEYTTLLKRLKVSIESNNAHFTTEKLFSVYASIEDFAKKEGIAKQEGIDNFKSSRIACVGSPEWKKFIDAAHTFAIQQGETYPDTDAYCILCQQQLSDDAQELMIAYWVFIKSQAEQNAKAAQLALNGHRTTYTELNYDLLPENSVLTKWLAQSKETLNVITSGLAQQKALAAAIVSDIDSRSTTASLPCLVDTAIIDNVVSLIAKKIQTLQEEDPTAQIKKIQDEIVLYNHKEKLEQLFEHIQDRVMQLLWADIAEVNFKTMVSKKKITDKEKELSAKYFNDAYVEAFNGECEALHCNIGIEINHSGKDGTSFRKLSLKGITPGSVLSEGEQKVISLADFLAELKLSEITRGVIFDDPVTSLDNERKKQIARRIVEETVCRQVIVFTHDLVFVSALTAICECKQVAFQSHWIERGDTGPGLVYLNNSPAFEKQYSKPTIPRNLYIMANNATCPPQQRESYIKNGFSALRTCYEVFVIHELFNRVVLRFNDRVSMDYLKEVYFSEELKMELLDSYGQCCRYMEGHTHSDEYAYCKPTVANLNEEINRYEVIKKKLKDVKETKKKAAQSQVS